VQFPCKNQENNGNKSSTPLRNSENNFHWKYSQPSQPENSRNNNNNIVHKKKKENNFYPANQNNGSKIDPQSDDVTRIYEINASNDINDINDVNDPIKNKRITAWNNPEIVELSTIAWKLGMKISPDYGSANIEDPAHFSLAINQFNLKFLYN
jgi:hypothetical protein